MGVITRFNNFYREHLDRFSDTAACLYRLTRVKVKFDWGKEEEDSLKKEAITEALLLVYPKEGEHDTEELLCDQERIVGNCGVYETF